MVYGLEYFNKVQVSGHEVTLGTALAATEILTGRIAAKPWDYKPKQDHLYNAGALIGRSVAPTVERYLAEFNYANDLDDREIAWLLSSALCERTAVHDDNNAGATYYQAGTVLTNGSATMGITDTDTDLESSYEDATGDSSYLVRAADEAGKFVWGFIRSVAKATNNYTLDVYDDITGSNQNWNGDQGTFDITDAVTWDIWAVNTWSYLPTWVSTGNAPGDTNGCNAFTWEMGNNELDGEVEYCFVQRLEIAGSKGGLCTVSADIVGRQFITTGSFTNLASTGIVTRVYFPFELAKFYIDNFNTNWATTFTSPAQIYNVESFSFVWESGLLPHFPAAGNSYFYDVVENPAAKKATLTLEQAQTSASPSFDTELAAALAGTARYVTIELYGTGGTRKITVQLKADYTDFPEGEMDGVTTFNTVLEGSGYGVGGAAVDILDVTLNSSLHKFP